MWTVLIVEDEPLLALDYAMRLADQGVEASVASSAEDALSQLVVHNFDAVLLDYKLPGMSGYQLAQMARGIGVQTPIFVVSACPEMVPASLPAATQVFSKMTQATDALQAVVLAAGR